MKDRRSTTKRRAASAARSRGQEKRQVNGVALDDVKHLLTNVEEPSLAYQAGKYLDQVKQLLVSKAKVYGDSAADPIKVFSKADAIERLNVRIDEKLSRFARGTEYVEDTEDDLIGLLALRRVLMKRRKRK